MTIAEQIYAIVESLPPEQANEVLTFAELIRAKYVNTSHAVNPASVSWAELINSLSGAWKDGFPDLETIRTGTGQDILRENL